MAGNHVVTGTGQNEELLGQRQFGMECGVQATSSQGGLTEQHRGGIVPQGKGGLALGLGWFSVGLGLAEVIAPTGLARLIGLSDDEERRSLLRAMGARELATGIGILSVSRPGGWLWARVAGDLLDLALLGTAFASRRSDPGRLAAATASVAGVTALDLMCASQHTRRDGIAGLLPKGRAVRTTKTITVNRPPAQVYQFWHDFQNLPRFMKHLESVETDGQRSHWVARAPGGTTVEWDAETIVDRPEEEIAWRSLPGAAVENSGVVRFRPGPGGRGIVVPVQL